MAANKTTFRKGHKKQGGREKGTPNKATDRARQAALGMLENFDGEGLVKNDILMLEPNERVNAYIRLLALILPKGVTLDLSAEATITIEDKLKALAEENDD